MLTEPGPEALRAPAARQAAHVYLGIKGNPLHVYFSVYIYIYVHSISVFA